ncbi:MAG: hypothetical protein ACOC3X_04015 [Nanoarchaeota archaeon]
MKYLEDNFLNHLNNTNETFTIINDRLYTFSKIDSNLKNNYLYHNNLKIKLEESEKISNLEEKLFQINKELIKKDLVYNIKKEIDCNYNEIINFKKTIDSYNDDNFMKKFIVNYLFKNYCSTDKIPLDSLKIEKFDNKKIQNKNLSYLNINTSYFSKNYDLGLLTIDSKCYILKTKNNNSKNNQYLMLNNKKLYLTKSFHIKELTENYNNAIKNYLLDLFKKKSPEVKKYIKFLDENNKKIMKIKNNSNELSIGKLSCKKINKNKYTINKTIPAFIFGFKNKYYHFPETEMYIDLIKNKNSIEFLNKPSISNKNLPYNHPFVYIDGRICLGNDSINNLENFNFFIDKNYDLKNLNLIAKAIINSFEKTQSVLEKGFFLSNIVPADGLWKNNAKIIASNISDAKKFAKKNNISNRIFEQNAK